MFHMTPRGPERCRATIRECPYGTVFISREAAEASDLVDDATEKSFEDIFSWKALDADTYLESSHAYLRPLPETQRFALKEYAHFGYQDLNEALYLKSRLNPQLKMQVKLLDEALAKAPDAPETLWRSLGGYDLPRKFLSASPRVGEILHFPGFTSTSETPDALYAVLSDVDHYMESTPRKEWATDGSFHVTPSEEFTKGPARNVIFKISARKAAPISTLRTRITEEEWLLPRNTRFVVRAIHRNVRLDALKNIRRQTRAQVFELEEI